MPMTDEEAKEIVSKMRIENVRNAFDISEERENEIRVLIRRAVSKEDDPLNAIVQVSNELDEQNELSYAMLWIGMTMENYKHLVQSILRSREEVKITMD